MLQLVGGLDVDAAAAESAGHGGVAEPGQVEPRDPGVSSSTTVPELCVAAFGGDLKAQAKVARLHIQSLADFPAGIKQTIHDAYGTPTATRPRAR